MIRGLVLFLAVAAALAQAPDPAYEPLSKAYQALQGREYETAITWFLKGIEAAPARPAIRKDLAYTYLKIGENLLAREQFGEAMHLDPADLHVALEFAFLCHETRETAQARRIFDRIRKTGDPDSRATAGQAFQNIDRPLQEGIERWSRAIQLGADTFSSHYELATLAEQRDELELAAEHYLKAWRLLPDRRSVLVELGRVWLALNRTEDANAALLAASRGGQARAAEAARELLPGRYPFVYEFRRALQLDPQNLELRRELAYLLLRMENGVEAEREFRHLVEAAPEDLLSAAQLGFLLLGRGDKRAAMPLLNRVLEGSDPDLANRVRVVLRLPQPLRERPPSPARPGGAEARRIAERSFQAGYLRDAVKYLQIAHESDPADFAVMLKLGWAYNILHEDAQAIRWFDLARKSPDPSLAAEANKAFHNLRPGLARFRSTGWFFPLYSSRWRDLFSYGQIKTEMRTGLPVRPYFSTRFIGDMRRASDGGLPLYFSESSFILAFGLATESWHGTRAWAEAGSAMNYRTGHLLPDYRGGVNFARAFGHHFGVNESGWFAEPTADAVFISRFGNDLLVYNQNRVGYLAVSPGWRVQLYWNFNLTFDQKRQYWANFVESGPGLRFRSALFPDSVFFTVNLLRGAYTRNAANPRAPNFFDLRAGFWYAFTY